MPVVGMSANANATKSTPPKNSQKHSHSTKLAAAFLNFCAVLRDATTTTETTTQVKTTTQRKAMAMPWGQHQWGSRL